MSYLYKLHGTLLKVPTLQYIKYDITISIQLLLFITNNYLLSVLRSGKLISTALKSTVNALLIFRYYILWLQNIII